MYPGAGQPWLCSFAPRAAAADEGTLQHAPRTKEVASQAEPPPGAVTVSKWYVLLTWVPLNETAR